MDDRRVIRLLVVEDNPSYQYLIKNAFSKRVGKTQWELTLAKDGEEALRILFDEERAGNPLPDLVLLDWDLPRVNGGKVLQRVKEHKELRKIPILIFSSSDSSDDIHSAYGAYANGFITKPGNSQALMEIIEAIELFWTTVVQLPKVTRPDY
jgi:two-component system, chemotaxis family, response regulator Rcp1